MKSQDNSKNRSHLILIVILLFLSRSFDIYTTYIYTFDLRKESNPLMVLLGWKGILICQFLVCAFFSYCSYIYFTSPPKLSKNENELKKMTATNFRSFFLYGNFDSLIKNSLKIPLLKPLLYGLGYIASNALIFAGFLIGISTSLLINSNTYQSMYSTYKIPLIFIGIILLSAFYFATIFYKREYKKYCEIK